MNEEGSQSGSHQAPGHAGSGVSKAGGRGRSRWPLAATAALLLIAVGFGTGWATGSIWFGDGRGGTVPAGTGDGGPVEIFMSGDTVRVSVEDGGPIPLKDSPGGAMVASLTEGWELVVVSGPRMSGGQRWYEVDVTDVRCAGTVRRGYVPAASVAAE